MRAGAAPVAYVAGPFRCVDSSVPSSSGQLHCKTNCPNASGCLATQAARVQPSSLHRVKRTDVGWLISKQRLGSSMLAESSSNVGGRGIVCVAVSVKLYSLSEAITEGPIELPPELIDPFAVPEASPLQIAASVVLTGLITVLLFRSIRRRSRKAKETKFRSSGDAKVSITEDARKSALALLNKAPEVETPPPNVLQTLSGAVVAGVIALVLYKFTVTVEAGFSGKGVSTNYSIRNLTITVRTIITGLCYLATFVFAANSVGLTLLSLQLALNIGPESPSPGDSKSSDAASQVQTKALENSTDEEDSGSSF